VKACPGSTVLLRMDGEERRIEPGEFVIETPKRPCVGVSPGSDEGAIKQLQDRGYVLEVGSVPEDFALHLGELSFADYGDLWKALEKLEAFPGPLVHFGTWPHEKKSAVAITGDIDALTIWDFVKRLRGA
jgi:hypothetical protein